MIPHRFGRLFGAVLLLAPSLAFGQAALQQPCTDRTRGCTVQSVPASIDALYANDVYLQGLIGTRFGQLGGAAFLNVGTMAGTVADGGALSAEISRAQAAEALKAPLASPAFTGTPTVPTAAPGANNGQAASTAFVAAAITAGGGGGSSYAVLYTAQAPNSAQQLQARQNIGAIASGDSHVLGNGSTATTQAAGDNTTKVATDAFVTGAVSSYAGTVAATYAPLASPTFTGTPKAVTASAGDSSTMLATTAYADRAATNAAAAVPAPPLGQVRLVYSSSSALLVKPYAGNLITVNGVVQTVPSGGVTCSNSGLTASTLYYAYLFVSGSTLTCEMVTIGHATGTNGAEIKSGDAARTLVGMIYTGAGTPGTFIDSPSQRFVASWFNRLPRPLNSGANVTYSNSATSSQELTSASSGRPYFLTWGDSSTQFGYTGSIYNDSTAGYAYAFLGLDGAQLANVGGVGTQYPNNSSVVPITMPFFDILSEGLHYGMLYGYCNQNRIVMTVRFYGTVNI